MQLVDLLSILCCPESHQPLRLADADLLRHVNERIRQGTVRNKAGVAVTEPIEGGLVREDSTRLYPIRQDLPILLVEEGIPI